MDVRINPGAVVAGNDFHAGWQRGFDIRELLLDAVDDIQRVHAVAHHDDAANGFSLAVPFGHSLADVRPEGDCSQVADQHGRAVLGGNGNGLQIAQRPQIAEAANHVFRPAQFK